MALSQLRPASLDELASAASHETSAPQVSEEDLEALKSREGNVVYNTNISETDLINLCLIHSLNCFNNIDKSNIHIRPDGIYAGNIKALYFPFPESRIPGHFGGWKRLAPQRGSMGHGCDMLSLIRDNYYFATQPGFYYDFAPLAKEYLKAGTQSIPFITPKLVQGSLPISKNWLRSAPPQQSSAPQQNTPELITPYILAPHLQYDTTNRRKTTYSKLGRWIIKDPKTKSAINLYILYTLCSHSPLGRSGNARWLPANIPRGLEPMTLQRSDIGVASTPLLVLRDCHVNPPRELKNDIDIIAWPSSVHGATPSLFDWSITAGRTVYIYVDSTTHAVRWSSIATAQAIALYSPKSIRFVCNLNPTGIPLPHDDYFRELGFHPHLALTTEEKLRQIYPAPTLYPNTFTPPVFGPAAYPQPPTQGSIALIHGTPLIGKTTITAHLAVRSIMGRNRLLLGWPYGDIGNVLYISGGKNLTVNRIIGASRFDSSGYKQIVIADSTSFLIRSNLDASTNALKALSLNYDLIVIDSPENIWEGNLRWSDIARFASELRDSGKHVMIVTETKHAKALDKFSQIFSLCAEICCRTETPHSARDIFIQKNRNTPHVTDYAFRATLPSHPDEEFTIKAISFPEQTSSASPEDANVVRIKNCEILKPLAREILLAFIATKEKKLSRLEITRRKPRSLQLAAATCPRMQRLARAHRSPPSPEISKAEPLIGSPHHIAPYLRQMFPSEG